MPSPSSVERLADQRYLTVLLRLVLNAQNELVYGEIINSAGDVCDRFQQWERILALVQLCLGIPPDDNQARPARRTKRTAARKSTRPRRPSTSRKAS